MNLIEFTFYFFIITAAASALGVLLVRHVLYAALLLIICLLCLAAIYIFMQAEFLAVAQIMIYAGGILVLLIFGIMLTVKKDAKPLEVGSHNVFSGLLLALGFFAVLLYSLQSAPLNFFEAPSEQTNNLAAVGVLLMSDYTVAFELAGILLLVTLVGASIVAAVSKHG